MEEAVLHFFSEPWSIELAHWTLKTILSALVQAVPIIMGILSLIAITENNGR
jgi:hypothetical protein